jgi:hypothetical protein
MRAVILALAIAGAAGAASAQISLGVSGGEVPHQVSPTVPAGAVKQAKEAIQQAHGDREDVAFRAVRAIEVASVKQGAFSAPIDGPVAVVCGQVSAGDPGAASTDYYWFFVAIKRGHILWTAEDKPSNSPGDAYYSCKGAGLAD